jgi:hypothetical protein
MFEQVGAVLFKMCGKRVVGSVVIDGVFIISIGNSSQIG